MHDPNELEEEGQEPCTVAANLFCICLLFPQPPRDGQRRNIVVIAVASWKHDHSSREVAAAVAGYDKRREAACPPITAPAHSDEVAAGEDAQSSTSHASLPSSVRAGGRHCQPRDGPKLLVAQNRAPELGRQPTGERANTPRTASEMGVWAALARIPNRRSVEVRDRVERWISIDQVGSVCRELGSGRGMLTRRHSHRLTSRGVSEPGR